MELLKFYDGKAIIEKKPWGEYFTYRRQGERDTLLSATRITSKLSKGDILLNWAIGLITGYTRNYIENSPTDKFLRQELLSVIDTAMRQPEEMKIKGGIAGSFIHTYAHAFALAKINGTELPTPDFSVLPEDVIPRAENGVSAFLDWFNNNDVEFLEMEKTVYYNSFFAGDTKEGEEIIEYIGILDLLAIVNGKLTVVDYKSSKGIYSEQRYQVGGYCFARNSEVKDKAIGMIVDFHKETGELLMEEIAADDASKNIKAFLGLYQVAKREKELGIK
jgi:hypothetical protein